MKPSKKRFFFDLLLLYSLKVICCLLLWLWLSYLLSRSSYACGWLVGLVFDPNYPTAAVCRLAQQLDDEGRRLHLAQVLYHFQYVRKCKNRYGFNINYKTILTFPDEVDTAGGTGVAIYLLL